MNISWNLNPEPDIYQYWLYKSVDNLNTFQIREIVNHPDSTVTDKDSIQPGNLYGYALLAVDSAGNLSEFSDTVAVGIPKIDWQQTWILSGRTNTISLSNFLYDPDHATTELSLIVSNQTNVSVDTNGGNLLVTPDPFYYTGMASFDLRVTDPTDFWDSASIQFVFLQTAPSSIDPINDKIPSEFQLYQNFPNPFNPSTWIQFAVPRSSEVEIAVFNILGEKIEVLFQDRVSAGYYGLSFNASHLSSGTYFLMLNSDKTTLVKRILLIK